jgi:hypothetical protein
MHQVHAAGIERGDGATEGCCYLKAAVSKCGGLQQLQLHLQKATTGGVGGDWPAR